MVDERGSYQGKGRESRDLSKAGRELGAVPLPYSGMPDNLRCSWVSGGNRCKYPGTITHSTLADSSTKWFCRFHFDCEDPIYGARVVDVSQAIEVGRGNMEKTQREAAQYCAERGLTTVAKMVAHIKSLSGGIGARKPSTDWARKIRDRVAKGENLPLISRQKALLALGPDAEREPGEEG